jgi:hypothetical protein
MIQAMPTEIYWVGINFVKIVAVTATVYCRM